MIETAEYAKYADDQRRWEIPADVFHFRVFGVFRGQKLFLCSIHQHEHGGLTAERDTRLGVRKLKAVGVVQDFNPPHALRQFGGGRGDEAERTVAVRMK